MCDHVHDGPKLNTKDVWNMLYERMKGPKKNDFHVFKQNMLLQKIREKHNSNPHYIHDKDNNKIPNNMIIQTLISNFVRTMRY